MAKKKNVPTSETAGLTSNPFAQLADLGVAPASAATEPRAVEPPAPAAGADTPSPPAIRRAVIRYQRKGRGGKEVTALELRGLPAAELGPWLTDLKKRLGCGGFLEDGGVIVLAGDQRQRLRELLERAGVAKISVS